MSKNITIQEGGVAKQLTVDKLKTNEVGGGSCLWVPEDDVVLGQKSINENGTYVAADDGYYGYSQVTVNGIGAATGKIPSGTTPPSADGNEYVVTTDNSGNLTFQKLPSSIRVTTLPTKTEYNDGETIDYTGMVVTAYDINGQSMGAVTFSELTLPVSEADVDATHMAIWTDGAGINAVMLSYVERWYIDHHGNERAVYVSEPVGVKNNLPAMYGVAVGSNKSGPTQFFITKYDGRTYVWGSTADRYLDGYTFNAAAAKGNYDMIKSTTASTGTGPMTSFGYVDDWATEIPYSMVRPTGTPNVHQESGNQTIPVRWARPGDGKVLETSFEITVEAVET